MVVFSTQTGHQIPSPSRHPVNLFTDCLCAILLLSIHDTAHYAGKMMGEKMVLREMKRIGKLHDILRKHTFAVKWPIGFNDYLLLSMIHSALMYDAKI